MKDYKILIPSYHRAERQRTLDLLHGSVFTRDDIVIATQTESDHEAYTRLHGERAQIIYRPGDSVGDNRNTLLEWAQNNGVIRAVMLDDDIAQFKFYNFYRTKDCKEISTLFDRCFDIAARLNADLWGTYPMDNPQSMRPKLSVSLLTGTCIGILNNELRFNPTFRIKEDYELTLRLMSQGRRVIRFNHFAPSAAHKTRGGCYEDWTRQGEYAELLLAAYPELVEIDKRKEHKEIKLKRQWHITEVHDGQMR